MQCILKANGNHEPGSSSLPEGGIPPVSCLEDLPWRSVACWTPTGKFGLFFGEGKHGPEVCGSCRQGHVNCIICALPTIPALLSHWSCFYLGLCPTFLPSSIWLFCLFPSSFHEGYRFHQHPMSSARILTGAPSAGRMPLCTEKFPCKTRQEMSLFFFSISLHVLLPNKGMTLKKYIYTLSIKMGTCLSPITCYHSETYSGSMAPFKAGWILQGSFTNFSGFGVEPNAARGNDGVQNCEKSYFEFLAHYARINFMSLPAFCWIITPSPTRDFCQWLQPGQDIGGHKFLAA